MKNTNYITPRERKSMDDRIITKTAMRKLHVQGGESGLVEAIKITGGAILGVAFLYVFVVAGTIVLQSATGEYCTINPDHYTCK